MAQAAKQRDASSWRSVVSNCRNVDVHIVCGKRSRIEDLPPPREESEEAMSKKSIVNPIWLEWIKRKAEKNIDKWGVQNFETLALAVSEESGELAQAVLQYKWEGGKIGRISQEALDLAALCVQVLVTMSSVHGARNVWSALFENLQLERWRGKPCKKTNSRLPIKWPKI